MISPLKWESVHSTGFGACVFFKCKINKDTIYTIDINPELNEYKLHLIHEDGRYNVLGEYLDFESASLFANYHYRNYN